MTWFIFAHRILGQKSSTWGLEINAVVARPLDVFIAAIAPGTDMGRLVLVGTLLSFCDTLS